MNWYVLSIVGNEKELNAAILQVRNRFPLVFGSAPMKYGKQFISFMCSHQPFQVGDTYCSKVLTGGEVPVTNLSDEPLAYTYE